MTDYNQFHESFNVTPPPAKKIPDMINVLTILTFVACALGLLHAIYSYFTICNSIHMMEESMNKIGSDNPMSGMMDNMLLTVQKQCDLRTPILIVNILTTGLCFVGAMMMRQLKKAGFFIYVIGEIGAPIATIVLLGSGMMSGLAGIGMIFVYLVCLTFIILYATQLKKMK